MKRILFTALPVFALTFTQLLSDPLPIGAALPRPEVKMKAVNGKEISFRDAMKSNGLLVMFTCNTCPYVIKNQERTREVCKEAEANGIGVVLLNANEAQRDADDSFEAMKTYAVEQGYTWPYLTDEHSAMADAFGATRTPECFLFDKNALLVYHGAIDDNPGDAGSVSRKHLMLAIAELKEGKEISVKKTRSVGCSIKRN